MFAQPNKIRDEHEEHPKPFKCGICDSSFRKPHSLRQHMNACHGPYTHSRCSPGCNNGPTTSRAPQVGVSTNCPNQGNHRRSKREKKNIECSMCSRALFREKVSRLPRLASIAEVHTRRPKAVTPPAEVGVKMKLSIPEAVDQASQAEKYRRMRAINNKSSTEHRNRVRLRNAEIEQTLALMERDNLAYRHQIDTLLSEIVPLKSWYANTIPIRTTSIVSRKLWN